MENKTHKKLFFKMNQIITPGLFVFTIFISVLTAIIYQWIDSKYGAGKGVFIVYKNKKWEKF
jgi:hypothetical protein